MYNDIRWYCESIVKIKILKLCKLIILIALLLTSLSVAQLMGYTTCVKSSAVNMKNGKKFSTYVGTTHWSIWWTCRWRSVSANGSRPWKWSAWAARRCDSRSWTQRRHLCSSSGRSSTPSCRRTLDRRCPASPLETQNRIPQTR